ncbi:MAG: HAMP domain-containing sensor histidine kinase, partial [bacterium]
MRLRRHLGLLYGILVALILVMGVWWVYFLNQDARSYEQYRRQHMSLDRLQAIRLLDTFEAMRTDPAGQLGEVYPFLRFTPTATGHDVSIDPAALAAVSHEARRRQRMFTAEGIFFLLLLAAGTTVLTLAYRSERAFKQARELFLAGATHELKTPLASLRLYLETLERPDLTAADAARIRPRMLEDLERLENLVEQILALGYLDSAGPTTDLENGHQSLAESLDVASETRQVVADLANLAERRGAKLHLELAAGLFIRGRSFDFSLALRNLITNAIVHSPPPASVRLSTKRDGDWIRLAV